MFLDASDKKLKVLKSNNTIIEYTNSLSDVQLLDLTDYTGFEVYANDEEIPPGEFTQTIDAQTFTNAVAIPAGMRQDFKMRTMCPDYTKSDVVIDWGDGTFENVCDGSFINGSGDVSNGEFDYTLTHTYTTPGKYIIRIFGKDYYCIYNGVGDNTNTNLVCRAITHDLPVASHLLNLSRFLAGAARLLYVNVDRIKYNYYTNMSSFCKNCVNLVKAIGFGRYFQHIFASNMFDGCITMTTCDLQLPYRCANLSTNVRVFYNCSNLAVDINKLFPERPMQLVIANSEFKETFTNCAKLFGTISETTAKMMWNMPMDGGAKFVNTSSTFAGCSAALRAQIPAAWGGTALNNIITSQKYQTVTTFMLNSYVTYTVSSTLSGDITYAIPAGLYDAKVIFKTGTINSFTLTGSNMRINKPLNIESNKNYIISIDNGIIIWDELITL